MNIIIDNFETNIVYLEGLRTLALVKNIIRKNVFKKETPWEKLRYINDVLNEFDYFQDFIWHPEKQIYTPHSFSRVNQKRTGDHMSIHEAIDEMKYQEEIIQQLDPHAVELWRQGQEILENYPVQIKEPTAELAKWFLKNHLQQIKTPKELEKAYYSHSFSNPLFEKWKRSKNRASYQTAEDVAFQWRLQELVKKPSRIKLDSPEAFQEAMNRKLPIKCPFTEFYCEHWKVIETRADRTWIDGCVANPKVHSIPKFCKRTNWDLINVIVNTEREKKFRDLYKRLVEKSKLWIYSGVEVRTDFHTWLIRNHLI